MPEITDVPPRPEDQTAWRDLPRPLSESSASFLDDLFVLEEHRGSGGAGALVNTNAAIGKTRDWAWLRRFTTEYNYRGRGFCNRVTHATPRKTYQVDIQG